MNSCERVLAALNGGIPDIVPYMDSYVGKELQERILGREVVLPVSSGIKSWGDIADFTFEHEIEPVLAFDPELAEVLGFDAVGIDYLPPLYINISQGSDGQLHINSGRLQDKDDLKRMKLPDPDNDKMYKPAAEFLRANKGKFATYARIRLGVSATLLSLGNEGFAYKLIDCPDYVIEVLSQYTHWSRKVSKNLSELGFDFLWAFDDVAFKSAPMFSLSILRDIFMPGLKTAVEGIGIPWIFHSDGNLLPFIDDLLSLGMNGLHPLEPGAMDLDLLKSQYGKKVCLVGNIDLDYTLTRGSTEEVRKEVRQRIDQLAPGGGYIITSSNSLPSYCKAENVIAMSMAVKEYRNAY